MGEIEDEILEQTKGVAVEAYKDLVRPSAKPLGEILSLFPRTIRLAFSGWEKWLINREESLRQAAAAIEEKVMKIPEEKVVEPEAYVAIPAMKQPIAVRVPEGNIAQAHASPVTRKKMRCFLTRLVRAKIRKATDVEAMPIPKLAASL